MATTIDYLTWGLILGILSLSIITLIPSTSAYYYVQQGDTITLGETYDLTGVCGWTGKLGYWEHSYQEKSSIEPDIIIDLNNYRKIEIVFLDPTIWKVGNWYQWDGKGEEIHENTFVFRINNTKNLSTKVNISNITPRVTTTRTPDPTPIITPVVIPLPQTTTVAPVVTRTFPPPKGLPLNPIIPLVGVLISVYIFLKFQRIL